MRTSVGEEGEFLQRQRQVAVGRVALDIGIELGGEELAVELVGLELGHIDAVGGEAAHRLVERGGNVAHAEDKGGDDLALAARGALLRLRQDDEARGVVGGVLDVLRQNIEAVDAGGDGRGERGLAEIAGLGDLARGAGRVAGNDRLPAVLADDLAALAEGMDVAVDAS